ncbi:MAG: 16S rRNA (cytosine(1402)-N(4))-methyltransferase RsmH, partial [Thermoanaerobacterales bacterium]|nr:16S rRNA (cytosine(1402)-N(4))-methyltransferase RsmH [Thermoanaerobacterales bacterium]
DRDKDAITNAVKKFSGSCADVRFIHDNYINLINIINNMGLKGIDGIVFDLGVSSFQLDEGSRGFSYMHDSPLDMRMDKTSGITAEDVVNKIDLKELRNIIRKYGEEPWAGRIANFICAKRKLKKIETTGQLAEIIKEAIPARARRRGHHPAKRTFQAIRIYVNDELSILGQSIKNAVDILNPAGRICVISFHSLEDKIVKSSLKELAQGCTCPKDFPICTCGKEKKINIITRKPIYPTVVETEKNPRSRSAKLRAAEKLAVLKRRRSE